jgi:hypothetical protein
VIYKEYRPDRRHEIDVERLERFPRFVRTLTVETLSHLYGRAAWPTWLVEDEAEVGSRPVGVVMPLAPPRFMAELRRSSGGRRLVPAKVELLLNGPDFLRGVGLDISMRQRIQLLSSVAETVAFLHAHSIAVGDFSCKNILFAIDPEPGAFFIDCDSMCWNGAAALPAGETPEWELPEGDRLGTKPADVYKFALLVLRMHTGAQHHRSVSRLPDSTWPPLVKLLERTLNGPSGERPLITDWTKPLEDAAAAAPACVEVPQAAARHVTKIAAAGWADPSVSRPWDWSSNVPASARPATVSAQGSAGQSGLLPSGPVSDFVIRLLRRLLLRQPANPSLKKLASMILGLWIACAVAFGVAVAAGMDPRHMGALAQIVLFGSPHRAGASLVVPGERRRRFASRFPWSVRSHPPGWPHR